MSVNSFHIPGIVDRANTFMLSLSLSIQNGADANSLFFNDFTTSIYLSKDCQIDENDYSWKTYVNSKGRCRVRVMVVWFHFIDICRPIFNKIIHVFTRKMFVVIPHGWTTQYNLGGIVSFSSMDDSRYCGQVYAIVKADIHNDIHEILEDRLHELCNPVIIICEGGEFCI